MITLPPPNPGRWTACPGAMLIVSCNRSSSRQRPRRQSLLHTVCGRPVQKIELRTPSFNRFNLILFSIPQRIKRQLSFPNPIIVKRERVIGQIQRAVFGESQIMEGDSGEVVNGAHELIGKKHRFGLHVTLFLIYLIHHAFAHDIYRSASPYGWSHRRKA